MTRRLPLLALVLVAASAFEKSSADASFYERVSRCPPEAETGVLGQA